MKDQAMMTFDLHLPDEILGLVDLSFHCKEKWDISVCFVNSSFSLSCR